MNEFSFQLCLNNPAVCDNKEQLIAMCQQKLDSKDDKNCLNCCAFIQFANDVPKDGIVELKLMFTKNFPHRKYTSSKAVRHLMQLPVIIIGLALGCCGSQN